MPARSPQDVTDDAKRRIQVREVIRAHLDKERELFAQGIKALSLFFIDEVAKYRDYEREDTLGEYARCVRGGVRGGARRLPRPARPRRGRDAVPRARPGDPGAVDPRGLLLDRQEDRPLHRRQDRGPRRLAGQSDDVDAYDLILKDKERLLSFEEPVRFIWSHSALREGWDNPNVFVMGMLKKSDNTTTRRQEIGRGLRLRSTSMASGWTTPSPSTTSTS